MLRRLIFCLALSCTACEKYTPVPTAPDVTPLTTFHASGTVVEIDGGVVAGATISAKSCDESPSYNHVFGDTQSDGGGHFRLTVDAGQLPIGCVYLVAAKDGYVRATLYPKGSADDFTIRMQRLREARGTVVEVDGGPVASVSVSTSGSDLHATTTNATGYFALSGVGRTLWLSKNGYVRRYLEVREGQDVDLGTVNIQRAITLSNRSPIVSRISSADVQYDFSDMWDLGIFCNPCKWIDVETGPRTLLIRLTWKGDIPLTLWTARDYYDPVGMVTAKPGDSAVTVLAPPDTARIVLIGIRSTTFDPQPVSQPVLFELTATAVETAP